MLRIMIIYLSLLIVFFINLFQVSDVKLKMDTPAEIVAGSEFEVRVTIDKGDVESFSRFQQMIPAGLTASSYLSSNADFSFEEKRVRMIWLKLPDTDEFTFAYKVRVDERLKGTFSIGGKFSYIDNNERKSVTLAPQSIYIRPSPNIDPELVVDINEFEDRVIQYIPSVSKEAGDIACIRQKPYPGDDGNEYIVNILVNKEDKKKFAKIEETVPSGYTAVDITDQNGIFTFKDQKAKFLWMNLPAEPYYVVTYRLIPKNDQKLGPPVLSGRFSYLVGEKTISIDVIEKDLDLASITDDQLQTILANLKAEPVPLLAEAEQKERETVTKEPEPVQKEPVKTKITKPKATKTGKYKFRRDLAYVLEPESGTYYRVQVAAGHKPVDIKRYFRKYKLDREVRKEYHEEWLKYSVGSFKVYKEARDYRVDVWNNTDIDDAFVAAYNNGQRITVQEALMIANQKWYK
jgi:hypothetical protein